MTISPSTISMSTLGDETKALLQREWRLMVPLALVTVGLGAAVSGLIQPELISGGKVSGSLLLMFLGASLWTLFGNLALMALCLTPGISVGESLQVAGARMPKMLLLIVIAAILFIMLLIPLALVFVSSGVDLSSARPTIPPLAAFVMVLTLAALVYVMIRLITLNAEIVDHNPPVLVSIRNAFAATRGMVTRLIGIMLLFLLVALVLGAATTRIFGLLFKGIANLLGAPFAGDVLTALVNGMLSAGLTLVSIAFTAQLYRALSARSA